MKQLIFLAILVGCLFSCTKKVVFKHRNITSVEIKTLLKDSTLNVRALEVNKESVLIATAKGETKIKYNKSTSFIDIALVDTINKPNFRSAVLLNNSVLTLSIASPALLYKDGVLVYQENDTNIFYDAMEFWNDEEGIAIGDSTYGCLSIIITRDGGENWKKLLCRDLPKGTDNEGAFAASDTNIAIVENNTWVATTAGRVYYSPDKGQTWDVLDTPIVKNKETEGIYSIDFYDELNGFAIGGDYTKPDDNAANKIKTTDGGKTWQLVAKNQAPGYRSCVQYIPKRRGEELVAVGFNGIDYSNDAGKSWKHLSDEGFYTIRFLNDSIAYAAGNGRVSKLIFKE